MDTNKPLSLLLVAMLVASVFTVVGITSIPLRNVSAQTVTIETSVDELGGTFFGHGAVQVVIEDASTDDNDNDSIDVTIEADGTALDSGSFEIPNTSEGSQRFEFFLVHVDSDLNDIGAFDSIADTPTIITFGADGNLDTGDGMYQDTTFEISYRNQEVTIRYEEVSAELELDREVYGSTSTVYIRINDQDANLNPTERDSFELTDEQLGDLFGILGGSFVDGTYEFEETGDNTGVFELAVSLDEDFDATADLVQLTLNDQVQYDTSLDDGDGNPVEIEDGEVNDSTSTSENSFEIEDRDGEVDAIGDLTFASELKVTVRDNDQNIDSEREDGIAGALVVTVDAEDGDSEAVDLEETGDNTGVFEFDLANSELRITFLAERQDPEENNGILELRAEDIGEDIIITYEDPLDDNSVENIVAEFTTSLQITPGQLSAPEEVGVTDEFTVTLTEPDLNDNPRIRDAYTIVLTGESPFALTIAGADLSNVYNFEIEIDGTPLNFGDEEIPVTLRETGVNTGIFEFEIDMDDITAFGDGGDALEVSDGDRMKVAINDFMADTANPDEDDVTITIGRPDVVLDFSRTTVPLPPEEDTGTFDLVGQSVKVTMTLVDPVLNENPNIEDFYDITDGDLDFTVEVDGGGLDGGNAAATDLDDLIIAEGVSLADVMAIGTLQETGVNTGVFEADIEISLDGIDGIESRDWQNVEITFEYTNDEGDEESAGFTFRGNDGIVTVDQPSATAGTILTVTVEDQDLNLDDNEVDEFESSLEDAGIYLLAIFGEDDEIPGGTTQTFEETGEDTGIFTAEFEVGDDIQIVDVGEGDRASNILIVYNDEIDSTGGGGDELEVNVPVVSSTGSIQVSPDLVGPATTLTILIVDSDLDADANSIDEYSADELDGKVEFASSRSEVGEGIPDIEETGPNTGVFMFTLELITDADACADDNLDDPDFEAQGETTDASIGACPGDLIAISYEDDVTDSGGSSTVSAVIEVKSWDPEFAADKESYNVGDRVTITISDPDANRDPDVADTLSDIRVTSDSDRVGEEFSAIETGRDTGVFRLTFGTTSGTAGGAISVKQGDDITIKYTDAFPADFVDEESEKDFLFVVNVGGDVSTGATTVLPPELQDVTGQKLDEVSAGQQVMLATNVRNNNAQPQPFVALIEVRDSNGVTVFLGWQTGTLPANGQINVGLSWTPDSPGDYEVRTFVISSLDNPRVLSTVSTTDITVN